MKRVLITGANSYIGTSFEKYAYEHYPKEFSIDTVNMVDGTWREKDFSPYDIVYHVAGIAHADVGNVTEEVKKKYYAVNTDLAIETAKKAKKDGVKQFVFMSSAIIYGDSAPVGKRKRITKKTKPHPANFYGDSKWRADKGVRKLADENFIVTVLRPPMIYGRGSKGNYPTLSKMAKKMPIFPDIKNERSMLYIENLCEFLCQIMIRVKGGIFWPQNAEYSKTSDLVKMIADANNHKILVSKVWNIGVKLATLIPGKPRGLANKAFGNMSYDQKMSKYDFEYQSISLKASVERTEEKKETQRSNKKKHILVVSQYFYPENFRINDMASEWVKRGYKVTVLTGIPNYPQGEYFDGYDLKHRRREKWNGVDIIRIPIIPRGNNAIGMVLNYFSFVFSGMLWNQITRIKADIVFSFEVSPMTQVLVGCGYAKRYKVPHFLYVQDLWPENVETSTGIHSRIIIGPIDKMVDWIYKQVDEIFVTSPSFVKAVINRKESVSKNKVHYWPQYAEEFYKPLKKQNVKGIPDDDSFKIAFTGNIGTAQGLDILPKTAKLLKNEKVKFVIVGDGRYQAEFEGLIKKYDVEDPFVLLPRVDAKKIPIILSACDACFISFNNASLWEMTIPAKLQSYMACGKAIIASASGETKRIIEEAGCGICEEIGGSKALARGIKELMQVDYENKGKKARGYFEDKFDKKKLMDEMDAYMAL